MIREILHDCFYVDKDYVFKLNFDRAVNEIRFALLAALPKKRNTMYVNKYNKYFLGECDGYNKAIDAMEASIKDLFDENKKV
jgi:hypothetical protein